MTAEDIKKWLEDRRTEKDFAAIKEIRDKCRTLLAVRNPDWFASHIKKPPNHDQQ